MQCGSDAIQDWLSWRHGAQCHCRVALWWRHRDAGIHSEDGDSCFIYTYWNHELSWCQLCHQWWHCRLSLWQPAVPPVATILHHCKLSTLSSLVALQDVITTTCSATSDNKVGIMISCQLCHQWWHCRLSLRQPAVPPVTTSWQQTGENSLPETMNQQSSIRHRA